MGLFQYKARDKFNKPISGLLSAASADLVAVKLKDLGYVPISIVPREEEALGLATAFSRTKIAFPELNAFTRQFHALQKAGIPILSAIAALKEQTKSPFFKKVIGQIGKDIESGTSLSAAIEKYPQIFNKMYVNMIKIGEASGRLDESLERLTVLGEHEERIRLRIKSATRYPIIVLTALLIGFIVLTTFVMPRFARIFSQFRVTLPLPTRILLGTHYGLIRFWWLILILAAALAFIFYRLVNSRKGRLIWDTLKLKIPVFGPLILKLSLSRFSRITSTLLLSGVPILQVLDLVSESAGNTAVSRTIDNIKTSVNQGKGMLPAMRQSRIFPPIVVQMVSAGEETGRISELLQHVADYYDEQIDYTINNMVSLIEPILIFILGLAVLLMALGIFLPMWNLISIFKR